MSKKKSSTMNQTKAGKLDTKLKIAYSELETLNALVVDKESLIDNLMARAGELESSLVEKEGFVEGLQNEITQQSNHITSLNTAIIQRDEHVAALETKTNKILDLLAEKDTTLEKYDKLASSIVENQIKTDQCLDLLSSNTEREAVATQYNHIIKSVAQHHSGLLDHIDSYGRRIDKFSSRIEELRYLSLKFEEANNHRLDKGESGEIKSLSNTISALKDDLAYRDQWGENTQKRLHELDQELSLIKKSLTWRAVSVIKLIPKGLKVTVKVVLKLLKLPYKLLVRLGWRFTPKLFHRIYHAPVLTNVVRQRRPLVYPITIENITDCEMATNAGLDSSTKIETSSARKPLKWHTGVRIDGKDK
jgi:predicted RNase H-like nuclease (RuvC/YqgF family)